MSLSSESGFIEYSDIRVDSLRMDNPKGEMVSCVDFFVVFKERDTNGDPGVHISIPLDKAKELADAMYELWSIKKQPFENKTQEVAGGYL